MILTGPEIEKQVQNKRILIEPFDKNNITSNSYDISISDKIVHYTEAILDPKKKNQFTEETISQSGYELSPNKIYLVGTKEKIGSNFYVPICKGRSSTARLGMFVHITADIIDLGSFANWTLQIKVVEPMKIYPFLKLAQATFWKPIGTKSFYNGKYQGSIGPIPSKLYLD